jgi:hypothetical protein
MKGVIFLILVMLITSARAQTKLQEADLKINGIGSGSSYSAVLAKFGKPTKQEIEKTEAMYACTGSAEVYRTLYYPGLKIELLKNDSLRKPTVVSMTVSSPKWTASGLRIGATPAQVARRFGKPVWIDRKGAKISYGYVTPGNLGGVGFEFWNSKLVSVVMSETLC